MNKETLKWPAILAAVMSFTAVLSWPYTYYQILRIVVCVAALYYLYCKTNKGFKLPTAWLAVVVAILFNPIFPVYLDRSIWTVLNLGAGAYFFIVARSIKTQAL